MALGFINIDVKGVDTVVAALRDVPAKLQKRVLKKAMNKAISPTLRQARRLVARESGLLAKSLGKKVKDYQSGNVVAVVGPRTGFKATVTRLAPFGKGFREVLSNPTNYAHLVEFGTRAHSVGRGSQLARTGPGAARAALRSAARINRWRQEIRHGSNRVESLLGRIASARSKALLATKQVQRGKRVRGARAQPFLRPAADQTRGEFLSVLTNEAEAGILKELRHVTEKEAIYAALRDHAGVKALTCGRVYPDQAPLDIAEPYLVFQVISSIRPKLLRGVAGIRQTRFQLTGFCETRKQAETLATAIEDLLDGKANTVFGELLVKSSLVSVDAGAVDEDDPEFGDRTVRMDVIWWA